MSYNASLSNKKDSSEFSTSWWKLKTALEWVQHCPNDIVPSLHDGETTNTLSLWLCHQQIILSKDALYGSTTVSDTFGEGMTEKVSIMPQLFEVHEKCQQGMFGSWKLNLAKGTERNWEHLQNILQVRCGLDIPHALWRSAMCPFQRRCRHRENGKAGSPADLTCWVVNLQTNCLCLYIYIVTEYSRGNTAWNNCLAKRQLQLYYSRQASVASLCFFSDNIKYRVNQLSTFGVVTLTGFSTTNSVFNFWHFNAFHNEAADICQNPIHEKSCKGKQTKPNTTLPSPNCCPHLPTLWQLKHRNTIIWQFNLVTSDIWNDYMADLGMNWMAKPIAWSVAQRSANSHTLQSGIPSEACLPKDKVIWAKQLAKWTSTNTVHCACKGLRKTGVDLPRWSLCGEKTYVFKSF